MNDNTRAAAGTVHINPTTGLESAGGRYIERERLVAEDSVSAEFDAYESPQARLIRESAQRQTAAAEQAVRDAAERVKSMADVRAMAASHHASGLPFSDAELHKILDTNKAYQFDHLPADIHALRFDAQSAVFAREARTQFPSATHVAFERERVWMYDMDGEVIRESEPHFVAFAVVLDADQMKLGTIGGAGDGGETARCIQTIVNVYREDDDLPGYKPDVGDLLNIAECDAWSPKTLMDVPSDLHPVTVTPRRTLADRLLGRHPKPATQMMSEAELSDRHFGHRR
jgi:hypothetical protein